jgi:hypothetical protein
MLGTPEARLTCTVTATTPGTSFVLTPVVGEHDAGLGITTITVACTANPNKTRLGERISVRLEALGG